MGCITIKTIFSDIHTWAQVLHIFKETKFVGNLCGNCSNYLNHHTTQIFQYISAKVLLLWFIAHWENDDGHGNMSPTKKWVCQLLVADTLNLAQRDYSSTFIVSMLPKRCQPISVCKVVNYWTWRSGLKQINIVNQFGDGQSDVDRFMSMHRQTGSAKDRPCLGGHKKANAWRDRVLAWMAIENRTKSSSQLTRECGIISTLDCPDQGLYSSGRSKNKTFLMPF